MMKSISLIAFLTLVSLSSFANRWQQRVEYKMDVSLDHNTHVFTGKQTLIYYNNSPDELTKAFYHLYFNAFQPGSAMDVRSRTISDPDPRVSDRISKLTGDESGYIHVLSLKMDGKDVSFFENETILEVTLPKAIPAGGKVVFEMSFEGLVPLQIRRSGRASSEGIEYSMSQWYPKLCEYDCNGWHPNPYIGREFYGVWGDFEVNITMDEKYMLAGTGELQNDIEIGKGYIEESKVKKKVVNGQLTWRFKALNVHDFVWAADPDYVHEQKQVPGGPMLHFFYQGGQAYGQVWKDGQDLIVKGFEYLSKNFGQYPYPIYSIIQGGDGGMEYPMATLITGNRKLPSFVGVTIHEAAHSWYQGVLATNESLYAWMDEGFTSYASSETMDQLFATAIPGDHSDAYNSYYEIVREGKDEALDTHADHFITNYAYGTAAYGKGEMYLAQLAYVIGEDAFRRGLLTYFNEWKFKHPTAADFLRVMEKESGMVLDWYHEYWVNTTKTVDYAITSVSGNANSTQVVIERKGLTPMPLDVMVELKDNSNQVYYIPLDLMRGEKPKEGAGEWRVLTDWKWVDQSYSFTIPVSIDKIVAITIDPAQRMADIDKSNNAVIPAEDILFIYKR